MISRWTAESFLFRSPACVLSVSHVWNCSSRKEAAETTSERCLDSDLRTADVVGFIVAIVITFLESPYTSPEYDFRVQCL